MHLRFLPMIALLFLAACSSGGSAVSSSGECADTIPLKHSTLLEIVRYPLFHKVTVKNPWDSTSILNTYILVPDSAAVPSDLPDGTIVKVPLKNSIVYSSVHIGVISELGAADMVAGTVDTDYIDSDEIKGLVKNGKIADCGRNFSPSIEKIIAIEPDAILLSPYENVGGYGMIDKLGVAVIECADYMEPTPLGRAEWVKFFGLLTGREEESNRMFDDELKEYNRLKSIGATSSHHPQVILDMLYGQVWHVPGPASTIATFIRDGGGCNPFDSLISEVSAPISAERMLYDAREADYWMIRYASDTDLSLSQLQKLNPVYGKFAAYNNKRVYGCNTLHSSYYSTSPFHPHLLLNDILSILHPELMPDSVKLNYFEPLR